MRRRDLGHGDEGRAADRKPYAVLDVETDGLRGELVYWTATCECSPEHVETGSGAAELWALIAGDRRIGGRNRYTRGLFASDHRGRDHIWWAHNGGEYDYLYLFDPIKRAVFDDGYAISPVARAGQIIGYRATHAKHRTDLRDSYALLPSRLADLAAQLAPEMPKGDIGLADGVRFDPTNVEHREYAAGDSRSLVAVLTRYRDLLGQAFDGALPSWSAASTALRAWQRTLPDDASYRRPAEPAALLARAGYVGGMVHLSSAAWHDDLVTIDVNAMYPAVMRERGVPDGWARPVRRFAGADVPGFYHVTVTVPADEPFTFLPYRDPTGALAWPTGTFSTVISTGEYLRARDRGYRITVKAGWTWRTLAYPFGTFVDRIERLRAGGGALGYVAKIAANSLYGKFGSRPTREEWMISSTRPGPEWWPPAGAPEHVDGLWTRPDVPLRAPYLMPHWAAWITAGARLRLCELADAIGPEHVIYTDTDSVTAPRALVEAAVGSGRITVGPAFGAVKIEHAWDRFRALAPKVTEGIEGDRIVRKAKGIPHRLMADAFATGSVKWDSPNAALLVLRGAPMTTTRSRALSSVAGSVAWRLDANGDVRPVHLGD